MKRGRLELRSRLTRSLEFFYDAKLGFLDYDFLDIKNLVTIFYHECIVAAMRIFIIFKSCDDLFFAIFIRTLAVKVVHVIGIKNMGLYAPFRWEVFNILDKEA